MNKIYLIGGAIALGVILTLSIFYGGRLYERSGAKVAVANEAVRQAKVLVNAAKLEWEREKVYVTKVKTVKEYIKANPEDCAAQPYNPDLVHSILYDTSP